MALASFIVHFQGDLTKARERGKLGELATALAAPERRRALVTLLELKHYWVCSCLEARNEKHTECKKCKCKGPTVKGGSRLPILEPPAAGPPEGGGPGVGGDEAMADAEALPLRLDSALLEDVMRRGLGSRTVSSIPRAFQMRWNRLLVRTLATCRADAVTEEALVRGLLLPVLVLRRVTHRAGPSARKRHRNAQQLTALERRADTFEQGPAGIVALIRELGPAFAGVNRSEAVAVEDPEIGQRRRACHAEKLARMGQMRQAAAALRSSPVAAASAATLEQLRLKHPSDKGVPARGPNASNLAVVVSPDAVLEALLSFHKGTSPAREGLRAQHLLDALGGDGHVHRAETLETLTAFVNTLLSGKAPQALAPFLAGASLIPLLKSTGGIRPIAVGCIWRRLISKVAVGAVKGRAAEYLAPLLVGVGTRGGAEAALHSVGAIVTREANGARGGSMAMALIDFHNAFNMVDRQAMFREVRTLFPELAAWVEYAYGTAGALFVEGHIIPSVEGVQQGDPLGPLLFALVLQCLLLIIKARCALDLQVWFLDDGTLVGDTAEVAQALHIIQQEGPALGLHLNAAKTVVWWPQWDPRREDAGLFPDGIAQLHPEKGGVSLLGGGVSLDIDFLREVATKRVTESLADMATLLEMDDPHIKLLILRACLGVPRLVYAMRTLPAEAWRRGPGEKLGPAEEFDEGLAAAIADIVMGGTGSLSASSLHQAALPIDLGGLGIARASDILPYAHVASLAQTQSLQAHLLGSADAARGPLDAAYAAYAAATPHAPTLPAILAIPKTQHFLAGEHWKAEHAKLVEEVEEVGLVRERRLLNALLSPHSGDFLLALPLEGLGQVMDAPLYRAVLRYRLRIAVFVEGTLCAPCQAKGHNEQLDVWGDHAINCRHAGFKDRHDRVRDVLGMIGAMAGLPVQVEPKGVSFAHILANGRVEERRPADVLVGVRGGVGGRPLAIDLTCFSPLSLGQPVADQMKRKAADKVAKHRAGSATIGLSFEPFVFTTVGGLAPEAEARLKGWQRAMRQVEAVRDDVAAGLIFRRVGFAIARGMGWQLVGTGSAKGQFV